MAGSFVYSKAAAGFRFIDVGILLLALGHVATLACSRRIVLRFPRALALPGIAFLLCIVAGIGYGQLKGGTNFFFDWRALALGICLYFVWAFWMQTPLDVQSAVRLFAVYMAAGIAVLYLLYLTGRGDTLFGIAIPIFDGPVLSAIVFAALLAVCYQENCKPSYRLLWTLLAAASYGIVLLCFRRTYWGELAVGTVILLLFKQRRIRNFVLIGAMLCLAAVVLGKPFAARVRSLDLMQVDGEFSADNSDHLHDLQDAWDQVRESPLMGIGVGT
ncbi:MAG: hypothetical protein ACLPND_02070, partial [Candidatus Korobacteraceae bacterium]